jgi:hypothetical protein
MAFQALGRDGPNIFAGARSFQSGRASAPIGAELREGRKAGGQALGAAVLAQR